ncbi:MAG: metallophosphoesterase family protein, partial [Candidatus Thermoplasmatota archaeon]|nr:metallophosphoesterase family protein [Candidatus Thermoplasmatota archaeon]
RERVARCLEAVAENMDSEPALVELGGSLLLAGDTHGDTTVTLAVVKRFFAQGYDHLVFLGDYVDRAPPDEVSSLVNLNYLLFLKQAHPRRVILLKGNHEAHHLLPFSPYDFRGEVARFYPGLYDAYVRVFERMPLMVLAHHVYAAHGGILPGHNREALRRVDKNKPSVVEAITWSDPVISPTFRGAGQRYGRETLDGFLEGIDARLFIKGHDYSTLGAAIFGGRCLTIFSSRRYRNKGQGGVLVAEVEGPVEGVEDVRVMDYYSSGKWRPYRVKIA